MPNVETETVRIAIRPELCRRDGLCAPVCPVRVFRHAPDETPTVQGTERCVLCGQCLAVCPHQAIAHSALDLSRFTRLSKDAPLDPGAVLDLLRRRRSVRVYKPDPVPRALLEEIAGVAGYAPTSAHGKEGWVRCVTIVSGAAPMQRVLELTVEYLRELRALLDSAPVKVIAHFKVEPRRGRGMLPDLDLRLSEHVAGRDAILYRAPAALFVHTPESTHEPGADCDAALFAMMIAAHAHGLGTCWNGWLAKAATAFKAKRATGLRRLLGIPEGHEVGAAMTLGYPAVKLHSLPQRETKIRWIE